MHAYTCKCMHVCNMCIYVHVFLLLIYRLMYAFLYTYLNVLIDIAYVHTHTYMHTYVDAYMCVLYVFMSHIDIFPCMAAYIHVYIYTNMYNIYVPFT